MSIDRSIPATMTAVRLHPPGGAEAVTVEEIVTPAPGENEILVRVHAAALTRDELDRLPAIPSYELSGTVVEAGPSSFAR
jgi:NADPH:quinone reductase-like Zn-dependent oxidoreductase